jgi:pyruvyltransferase
MIPAFWYLSNNFGDAITPYLINKISGKLPVWVEPETDILKYMITGSILNVDVNNSVVWGCGIAYSNDFLKTNKDVRAVRGRMTLDKYTKFLKNENKAIPDISVGDPCMLLPNYYMPKSEKKYKVGIVPHYIEAYYMMTKSHISSDIKVIDVNQEIEKFINDVNSCEVILSSSLHGIICADAYNIPSAYIKFTDKIGGDGFKYKDWFSNFYDRDFVCHDFSKINTINSDDFLNIAEKNKTSWLININVSLRQLFESCPFKP